MPLSLFGNELIAQLINPFVFTAFQSAPAGELYEQEFLTVVCSIESKSNHPIAEAILSVAQKNNLPIKPVVGFKEFPGSGVGGAVEVSPGVYRATVIGKRSFLKECGLEVPDILEIPIRKWEQEGALVILGGWDGWVRGVLKVEEKVHKLAVNGEK